MDGEVIASTVAAASAVCAALIAALIQRNVHRSQHEFEQSKRTEAFLGGQLGKLYLPVSMHLRATRTLANTHYGADKTTVEQIEHALHEHNRAIVDCLLTFSMYLEPDAPGAATIGLLEHLLQWETLYKLKHQAKPTFDGPIWDQIRTLGYSHFPDGAADHFHNGAHRIRTQLHNKLNPLP